MSTIVLFLLLFEGKDDSSDTGSAAEIQMATLRFWCKFLNGTIDSDPWEVHFYARHCGAQQ